MSVRRSVWMGLGLLATVACSAGSAQPPETLVSSQSGDLRVELSSPDGVVRGLNRFQFTVLDARDATPATELELRMHPFMPAMGHGTGEEPDVRSVDAGRYEFSAVRLNMAGRWQLRTTISGTRSDFVTFDVDVP